MLEKTVKAAVRKRLKEIGAFQFWPVTIGLGETTLDVIGCYNGRFYAVECKRPGGKLTERQKFIIEDMRAAGALVFVVDSEELARGLFADSFASNQTAFGPG